MKEDEMMRMEGKTEKHNRKSTIKNKQMIKALED